MHDVVRQGIVSHLKFAAGQVEYPLIGSAVMSKCILLAHDQLWCMQVQEGIPAGLRAQWMEKGDDVVQLGGTLGTIKLKLLDAQQKVRAMKRIAGWYRLLLTVKGDTSLRTWCALVVLCSADVRFGSVCLVCSLGCSHDGIVIVHYDPLKKSM